MRRFILFSALIFTISMATMPSSFAAVNSVSQVRSEWFFGRKHAKFTDVAELFKINFATSLKQLRLISKNKTIAVFTPDKRTATINGMPVVLNFAPTIQKGISYISWSDLINTVRPILQRSALVKHSPVTVIIDPGHGGKDPGAIGKISQEKNITLAIGKELEKELKKRGFKVFMTRTGDTTLTLEQRAAFCAQKRGQIFISIHADAAASKTASGIGTFSLTPAGAPSYNTSKIEKGSCKGHLWSNNSLYLSYAVQRQMALGAPKTQNRGLKRARFSVLRNTACPSILVETGFISNVAEERKLNDPAYRKKLAESIAAGVSIYKARVGNK